MQMGVDTFNAFQTSGGGAIFARIRYMNTLGVSDNDKPDFTLTVD